MPQITMHNREIKNLLSNFPPLSLVIIALLPAYRPNPNTAKVGQIKARTNTLNMAMIMTITDNTVTI